MGDLDKSQVAEKVQSYLVNKRPGGVFLEVVEEDIRKVDEWWRVPVRPSAWPARMFEYYEALAEVESDIQENERLNILLATGEPKAPASIQTAPAEAA